jgi:probable rRNA maturation factor
MTVTHVHLDLADPDRLLTPGELAALRPLAAAALAQTGAAGEVRVRLVADAPMAEAHVRYSGVAGTTDVLTFDLRPSPEGPLDTDALVCVDEARRNAAERGLPVERELALYILHAALHCLGHDDHDDEAHRRMHAEEDRVFAALGLGPVYAAPARDPGAGAAKDGDA